MKNDKYWQERFTELQKAQMNKGDAFNKRLAEEYQKAIVAISKEIAYWYQRFADNNEIDMAAARKMLTARELKELRWNVDEYMKKALHESQKYAKQLENASAKVHIDRLTALKIQMEMAVNELSEKTAAGLKSTLENIYEEGYYKSAYEIQKGVGFGSAFGVLDKETVAAVVAKPWTADGKNFSKRIWGDQRARLIKSLEKDLTQAIIRGDGPDGVIKKLTEDFGVARNRASTLVMTESAFFAAESSRKSMEVLEVEKFRVLGTLDKIACHACGEKDGKVYDMSEYEIGKTAPPFHPNCRCTTVPYRKNWDGDTRAARDENGKEIKVPADMTYAEWRRQFVDGEGLNNNGANVIMDMYKGQGLDIVFDKDVASGTINKVQEATKKITKDFKILEEYSEPVKFGAVNGGLAINVYDPNTGKNQITLLKSAFVDEKALLKRLNDDYISGYSFKTNRIESLVAHEMGHNAHIALALKRAGLKYGVPFSNKEEDDLFRGEYKKIMQEIYIAAFTDEDYDSIQQICGEQLGSMTIENPKELIAQSFGNYYYGSNKSIVAEKIVKYFQKELKK